MLAQLTSGAVLGVSAYLVRVEVDLANGLPSMSVVGLPEGAVREGRERVTAAVQNSGLSIPPKRITINLAPADVRKEGSAFDLPIALGVLAAAGVFGPERLEGTCFAGELGLDGELRPIRGVLPLALQCRAEGLRSLVVPMANGAEAAVVEGLEVRGARDLVAVLRHLRGDRCIEPVGRDPMRLLEETAGAVSGDYDEVRGQGHAKRAIEIAAAGGHNLLMIGPPGSGKSMLARRLPTILPPLTLPEALEITKVHSVAGRLRPGQSLVASRPFRAPHHTISDAGLIGGGGRVRPGEVSLAHHGVLFLDELPEFRRAALEALRQPLEDGTVHIGRARLSVTYPARFMLAAAMNPCPCGHHGDDQGRCVCHPGQVQRYRSRVSGPLLDRFDLHIDVAAVSPGDLADRRPGESSRTIRGRVIAARDRQQDRFRGLAGTYSNAHMGTRAVREFCRTDSEGEALLRTAVRRLGLSARAYYRVLKLARTIADLEPADRIHASHLAEAIQYRSLDRPIAGSGAAF